MPLFDVLELPFCKVLMIERWNDPPHRYFIAYRALNDFRTVVGLPVIDEFATFSSPIFFAPAAILGKIYNAGISLGHLRDRDMNIDTGWPPLCIGTNISAPELPKDWEQQLIRRIQSFSSASRKSSNTDEVQRAKIDGIDVFATHAPLLPKQLARICQISEHSFTIAFATGNRIVRNETGAPLSIKAVSEGYLREMVERFRL